MSYSNMWKEVEEMQKKDLPQSVAEKSQVILDKALKEREYGQAVKAALTLMAARQIVSDDSLAVDLGKLEQRFAEGGMNVAEEAVLHVLAASVYDGAIGTSLTREDEEALARFKERREAHVEAALKNRVSLVGMKAEPFAPLFKKGDDSRLFGHDVYSLVLRFIDKQGLVKGQTRVDLYKEAAQLYADRGMKDAAVLMKIEQLEHWSNLGWRSGRLGYQEHEDMLKELYEQNLNTEAGADAFLAWLDEHPDLTKHQMVEVLRMAQSKWKHSKLVNSFRNKEQALLAPGLEVNKYGEIVANQGFQVKVRHRQLAGATLQARRRDGDHAVVWEKQLVFPAFAAHPDSVEEWLEDTIDVVLPPGDFMLEASGGGRTSYVKLHATTMRVMMLTLPPGKKVVTVVNSITGMPVQDCTVVGTWSERVKDEWKEFSEKYTTDAQGQAVVNGKVSEVVACVGDYDVSNSCYSAGGWSVDGRDSEARRHCELYTDRAIYRPGQTVHVSAFVYSQRDDVTEAVEGLEQTIELRDVNGEKVGEETVVTDKFGSVSCDFVLPKGRLNGNFSLRTDGAYKTIRVEEYKRPTFTVEMEPVEKAFALGDTVELTGLARTYSGVPVQGARVAYVVEWRKSDFWNWLSRDGNWEVLESGDVVTDVDGRLRVKVYLSNDKTLYDYEVMEFKLTATVTDQGGESHEAQTTLRVSSYEFALRTDLGEEVEVNSANPFVTCHVEACNAQGQAVNAKGEYQLLRWNKENRRYEEEVKKGSFTTESPLQIDGLLNLPMGSYRLVVNATDRKGNKITGKSDFLLWSRDKAGEVIDLQKDWLHVSSTTFAPGKGVDIWFATAEPEAYTYLYIVDAHKIVKQKIELRPKTSIEHLHLDYDQEFGHGVEIFFTYLKDNSVHRCSQKLTLERPDKQLKLSWKTFRDRLYPGQQETWTLTVVDKDGKPVPAQLLATMYDASLEAFASHSLPFSLYFRRSLPTVLTNSSSTDYFQNITVKYPYEEKDEAERVFSWLKSYSEYSMRGRYYADEDGMMPLPEPMMRAVNVKAKKSAAVMYDSAESNYEESREEQQGKEAGGKQGGAIRENFNETAFFYPSLQTKADGSVNISFTLPESLTRWNVLALAHTKDMDYGHLSSSVEARKDFMVQPNMPRFVRSGDRMSIAAKIINTTSRVISGTAQMKLIDPATEKVVYSQKVPFNIEANGTTAATFNYNVGHDYQMFVCEITATSNGKGRAAQMSDGERNYLPVLSDMQHVTETVPFYILGGEEKELDITSLFNHQSPTTIDRSLAFEFTGNPSWSALMALHSVVNPKYDNAIAWSAALYANSVVKHLASRMPKLRSLIEQWNAESMTHGSEISLTSELQRNQELKDILLQETPWMLDAQHETEQRHQLCELFDTNLLKQRIDKAVEKLEKLQYGNGGWSWFDGMKPSYYVTLSVADHLALLREYEQRQNISDYTVSKMLKKGVDFLDKEELDYYKKYWKKEEDKPLPSESTFQYLYIRGIAKQDVSNDSKVNSMVKEYLDVTQERVRELTMYGRANVSVILRVYNRGQQADDFVKSLYQYTTVKPGMGRYFDTEKAHYCWMDYRIPTQVAAMRAFLESSDTDAKNSLLDMQLWLLRQKQTQQWKSELNIIGVCDLLMRIDPEHSFEEPTQPTVHVAGTQLKLNKPTAGLGYSKTLMPQNIAQNMPKSVKVRSNNNQGAISWGCVYSQCMEQMDRLEQNGTELTVERKIYIHRPAASNSNELWQEMKEGEMLHVGDKVRMRLIIASDRDMDFVQVRASHAACLEPLKMVSGYQWLGGRGGYVSFHDASADIFFDRFLKGNATIDLDYYVVRTGSYSGAATTAQCAYAPDFAGHSSGIRLEVGEK